MEKRTMIIVLVVALILLSTGIFIAFEGFSPYKETGTSEDGMLVAEQPENLSSEEETEEPDLEQEQAGLQQEEQSGQGEENLQIEEEAGEEVSRGSQIQEEPLTLEQKYELILESGKPSIIVFSYDADCCESTRIFFENYNSQVYEIMEEYGGDFDTFFINTGILSSQDMKITLEIAQENGVVNLPSILILDSEGKVSKVLAGPFEKEELEAAIQEVRDA
ncbi:MAG: TlpA family protein disulfide reductase [Actinomycetota bacterium]